MFSSFSWTNYFLFVGILLIVYCVIICFLYYRKEMTKLFAPKRDALNEMVYAPVKEIADPTRLVHELVSELGVIIRNAAEDNTTHPELFFSIQQTVKNYLVLEPTEYKGKINQYISHELEIRKIPDLSMEEYDALWK